MIIIKVCYYNCDCRLVEEEVDSIKVWQSFSDDSWFIQCLRSEENIYHPKNNKKFTYPDFEVDIENVKYIIK